jgi:hypothetical protein
MFVFLFCFVLFCSLFFFSEIYLTALVILYVIDLHLVLGTSSRPKCTQMFIFNRNLDFFFPAGNHNDILQSIDNSHGTFVGDQPIDAYHTAVSIPDVKTRSQTSCVIV